MRIVRRHVPRLLIAFTLCISHAFSAELPLPDTSSNEASPAAASSGLNVRGMLEPRAEATLSSQIAARVIALPYKEGDSFQKGAALVELDCEIYKTQLEAAEAASSAAKAQFESNRQLAKLNSIGALEVQLSEANYRKAVAEANVTRALTKHCTIKAPFAGRVVKNEIHNYESVSEGTELLAIVDRSTPDIRLIVPSKALAWLKPGTPFTFEVDETGASYPAKIKALGARIDAVSQTVSVRAQFTGQPATLTPGMSGTARFTSPSE